MVLSVIGVFLLGIIIAIGVAYLTGLLFVGSVGLIAFILKYAVLFLIVYSVLKVLGLVPKKNNQNGREV